MADITSVKLPNNSEYNIKDALAQPATLSTAITVDGTSQTTVEGALGAINTLAAANKSGKADKVSSPTSGDFAALDSTGNLTDSGKKAADFATDDEMSAVVNVYGAKNLLDNQLQTVTVSDITYNVRSNKRIVLSGTSSSVTGQSINTSFTVPATGKYILSGIPAGLQSAWTYIVLFIQAVAEAGQSVTMFDYGEGCECDLVAGTPYYVSLWIAGGFNTTGITVYPMLRDARITDNTYVPYAKTNRELTVITEEKFDLLAESTTRETVVGISDLSNVLKKYKYLLCKANIVIDGVENYRGTQVMIPTIESRVLNAPINVCGGSDYWQGETYLYVILDQAYGGISYWWAHYNNTADRFTNVTYKFRVYGLN